MIFEGQSWSPQHMPMAISANWAVLAALFMNYDAATTPDRSLTNTGGVWKKKWRRWAFYGLQRPLERHFLGKTRTFRPNELPQGFEILQRLGTQLLSLNPKKLQILV